MALYSEIVLGDLYWNISETREVGFNSLLFKANQIMYVLN